MTERDKIIEEMEFVIRPQACNDDICKLYNDKCSKCEATRLYDAGYRKVDKDSVFHIDISEELTKDFFQNEIKDARKEAIKEFVETVKRCLPNEPYVHTHIREIASIKFGVEVEE